MTEGTLTASDFLKGAIDSEWVQGNLDAHKFDVEFNVRTNSYSSDATMYFRNNLLTDPLGFLHNPFNEPLNITKDINNPSRPLIVSDTNAIFGSYLEDDRYSLHSFPYTLCGPDYISSLPKKKRDNFKNEIKKEVPIELHESSTSSKRWQNVVRLRGKHHNPDEDYTYYKKILDLTQSKVRIFEAVTQKNGTGVASVAIVQSCLIELVHYCYIFFSISPCIRQIHQKIVEEILPTGSMLHYGAAHSFDPEREKVFRYKRILSNRELMTPGVAIFEPDYVKPYYDLTAKRWTYA